MLPHSETLLRLFMAAAFGSLIGFERERLLWAAGIRTHMLVCVGACLFMIVSAYGFGPVLGPNVVLDPSRVAAQVVSGIGFLGAGAIMKQGLDVRGLNTAATLWASAAVGSCAGADMVAQAAALTVFVLAGNTLLRPLVNWVNRRPIDASVTEAKYLIHAVCRPQDVSDVRDLLDTELNRASYPVRQVETLSDNEDQVQLAAILVPTTADEAELDGVVAALEASPLILSATWSVEATS
jgi:putative Mg2+ transporter-C (MgtC) family protein